MIKRRKRLERIRRNPKSVSFEDLQQVLVDYGFTLERSSGSHHIFKFEIEGEIATIIIPFARPVKAAYVKDALKVIDEIEKLSEQAEDTNESSEES